MHDRPLPGWPRALREGWAAEYCGLSVTTMRGLRHRGEFPAPLSLTRGRIAWDRETLDRWIDERAGRTVAAADEWPDA